MKLVRLTLALLVSAALGGAGIAMGQNYLAVGEYDAGAVLPAGGFAMAGQFEGGYATQVSAMQPMQMGMAGGGAMMQPGGPMMGPAGGYGPPPGYEQGYAQGYGPQMGAAAAPPPPSRCQYYIRLEERFLRRDDTDTVNFASLGINGSIVLDSDDFDFENEGVSSFTIGLPICHCHNLELSYFGLQEWESTAVETSGANQLFSVYSDFGLDPPGGFDETDQASLQAISYESSLHNAEINFLHNGQVCCRPIYVLLGVRYVRVDESFEYDTVAANGSSESTVDTENDLVGFQMGVGMRHCCGDCCCASDCNPCLSCLKCLSFETNAKAGVFVNLADQQSTVLASGGELFSEERNDDNVAFVSEWGGTVSYSPSCCMSIRGGYHLFFVDGLALAPENFNRVAPSTGTRRPVLRDNGSILYHGPSGTPAAE